MTVSTDRLPSWRDVPAKQAILEFVAAVTDPDAPDFVPERDRVAVFDNDGTWTVIDMAADWANVHSAS
jgi:hypothetical protein